MLGSISWSPTLTQRAVLEVTYLGQKDKRQGVGGDKVKVRRSAEGRTCGAQVSLKPPERRDTLKALLPYRTERQAVAGRHKAAVKAGSKGQDSLENWVVMLRSTAERSGTGGGARPEVLWGGWWGERKIRCAPFGVTRSSTTPSATHTHTQTHNNDDWLKARCVRFKGIYWYEVELAQKMALLGASRFYPDISAGIKRYEIQWGIGKKRD